MSKKITLLEEDIQAQIDTSSGIEALAEKEERELNDVEKAEFNAIHGEDGKSGTLGELRATLTQHKNIEAGRLEQAAIRAKQLIVPGSNLLGTDGAALAGDLAGDIYDTFKMVKVPAKCKRHGPLRAFTGEDGERNAYAFGLWLGDVVHGVESCKQELNAMVGYDFRAAMSTTDGAGGETVPDITEAVLITIAEAHGVMRRFSRPSVMTSEVHNVPLRTAGLTVFYPAQNVANTPSDLTTDQVTLTAFIWSTITEVSDQLNLTSLVSYADEIAFNIGLAFALAEDTNGFNGDGTPTFGGITGLIAALDANSVFSISGEVTLATLTLAAFEGTAALLPRFTGQQPAWFVLQSTYFDVMVRLLHASGGTPGTEIAAGFDAMFMGYPVVFAQAMAAAAVTGDTVAYLGDLSQSVYMGTLQGMQVSSDAGGKYFEKNQIAIKGIQYADIQIENQDTASAGPVVSLELLT